jgi:hypothetical protein
LDLSNYKFPTNTGEITINQEELEENKTNVITGSYQNNKQKSESERPSGYMKCTGGGNSYFKNQEPALYHFPH